MPSRRPTSLLSAIATGLLLSAPAPVPAEPPSTGDTDIPTTSDTCEKEFTAGRYAQALPACQSVLSATEKLLGPEDVQVALWLARVGRALQETGKYAEAEPRYRRLLAMGQKLLGAEHPFVATVLNNLAVVLEGQGKYPEAERLHREALAMRQKLLGAGHSEVVQSLNNLGSVLYYQGKYTESERLHREALAMRRKLLGAEHPEVALSLNNVAMALDGQGRHAEAEPLQHQALAMGQKTLGAEHPQVALSLDNLALGLDRQGKYAEAERLHREALAMRQKLLGAEHPDVATSLSNLASVLKHQGRHAESEQLDRRALAMRQKLLGAEHPDVAISLNNLAGVLQDQGKDAEAEPLYRQALAMTQKLLGAEHPLVATGLNNLAHVLDAQGKYAEAERLYRQALAMRQKLLGAEHPEVAMSLNNLATVLYDQDKYAEAERLHRQALAIQQKVLGAEHPAVALSLNNLASALDLQGKYAEAEPLLRQALAMRQKLLGAEHPDVAMSLSNLASLYTWGDQPSQAIPLLSQLLEWSLRRDGVYTKQSLRTVERLITIHKHLGQAAQAGAVYDRLLTAMLAGARAEQSMPSQVTDKLARLMEGSFFHAWLARRFDVAERIPAQLRRLPLAKEAKVAAALTRMEQQLAETPIAMRRLLSAHRQFAKGRDDHHGLRLFANAFDEAVQERPELSARLLRDGLYLGEQHLRRQKSVGQVRAWLEQERPYLDLIFELARRQPKNARHLHLAWTATLMSKGRTLDAETRALRVLRSPRLSKLHAARMEREQQLSGQAHRLSLSGQSGVELRDVQAQRTQTTELMLESIEELRIETLPEPFELVRAVAATLPKDGVLVDYVEYMPPPLAADGPDAPPRYLALLLFPDERAEALDLGEVKEHEAALKALLHSLRDPKRDPREDAQKVYQRILLPVLKAAGAARQVFLSPDGALHLIPFDALHDGSQYMLDSTYTLRYLASGRDRIRLYDAPSGRPALVLGDPELRATAAAPSAAVAKRRRGTDARAASLYDTMQELRQLADARQEAMEVGTLLNVPALLGAQASEAALRKELVPGRVPRLLHLAMHGVFPDEVRSDAVANQRPRSRLVGALPDPPPTGAVELFGQDLEDPLLHSVLALSGAAQAREAEDSRSDGILTADEARELPLEGNELVVLSACQTALGSVRAGDGVYGLRRAFLSAGAEAVVASLWRVADQETRSLMTRYYELLVRGRRPRITAMREAMKAMKKDHPHPYFWAPFIAIGRDEAVQPVERGVASGA